MTPEQKQQLQQIIQAHIREAFAGIKAQTDKEGKDIAAYYFFLVEDFFATANAAITKQDKEDFEQSKGEKVTVLNAIWDGRCKLYEGKVTHRTDSDYWLDNQSEMYRFAYKMVENLEDNEQYEKIRYDYEECLLEALRVCDEDGVFGDRSQNGMLLFAFYIDDFDHNSSPKSILYRSSNLLNSPDTFYKL